MNWLERFVRPRIRALAKKADTPENLWDKCPACEQMIFHRELAASQYVCPHCGHHMKVPPKERFARLFDDGQYQPIELPSVPIDPLRFRDRKRYLDRLREAQTETGAADAVLVAHGKMGGLPAVVAAFDFGFLGGSMGMAVGEALLAAAKLAVLQQAALIAIPASGGARMQEGVLSLMQMARTTIGVDEVKEAGLPYIVVFANPTTGGVTASFAMLGDLNLAEPSAVIGFAGQRVIEETIREKLPPGFQRSEYLFEHGMVDMVVNRRELRDVLIRLLTLLRPEAVRPRAAAGPSAAAPGSAEGLAAASPHSEADDAAG